LISPGVNARTIARVIKHNRNNNKKRKKLSAGEGSREFPLTPRCDTTFAVRHRRLAGILPNHNETSVLQYKISHL